MKKILTLLLATTILTITLSASLNFYNSNPAHAQTDGRILAQENQFQTPVIPRPRTLPGYEGEGARAMLVQRILPGVAVTLVGLASLAALVWLIVSGVRFATAYGNEEKIESAKKQAMYSIAGLILALLAYTIVTIITRLELEGVETPRHEVPGIEEEGEEWPEDIIPIIDN